MYLSKWEKALNEGKVWRAKEILRSYIKLYYDTNIYKAYGKILYDLQDFEEAGKYLFMSGEGSDGKYGNAVKLFLSRHERADIEQFLSNLPKRFIYEPFDHYPENVRTYLSIHGYDEKIKKIQKSQYHNEELSLPFKIYGVVAILFIFLSIVVGGITIINWLLNV